MKTTTGRPRAFDRDTALDQAIRLFWQHGYEGTSIAALTDAMDIRPPSLYSAFGDKRTLFREAVLRYMTTYGASTTRALTEEPTARASIERMLREVVVAYTDPTHPTGCLVTSGATNVTPQSADVEADLRRWRDLGKQAIIDRVAAGIAAGEFPAGTDADALGTYVVTVMQGMAQQARDLAGREVLDGVVTAAMRAWPA
ncbi:TetR/AcrR family transcriptional regulator [Streptomyces phaeochromogenes]|uniref:TetR/AcrR family transcriptional regulator n=1 Tax=Streptomyces phaeochromogenes TaxID=1923 RepID=UPI002DD7C5F3|nr:TetR/AcrR family transcriptional regulator [Streptomyces phaeochromogenes]WRZ34589.1 TetR/AcrR family transcriptional regulator [Streptomyces phaeochromogenes]